MRGGARWAPAPGPSLGPVALTPGELAFQITQSKQYTYQGGTPSPRARRHAEDARGGSASSANSQPQSWGGPPPPPLKRCSDGHPAWGVEGQHPEDPRVWPPEDREGQGVTSAPLRVWGRAPRAGS